MSSESFNPPGWADRILEFYCKDDLLEDLQGDLHEIYQDNIDSKGKKRADLIYIVDVLKFFRIYTVKTPQKLNNILRLMIIQNYFKTSIRNIVKNWTFSLINVVGLAISMSVGLLMLTMVNEMKSYDRFHSNFDRIYRINNTYKYEGVESDGGLYASTSILAGKKVQETVTGLEEVVILKRGFGGLLEANDKKLPVKGIWASDRFFNLFDFKMIKGNPETALKEVQSIVITEETAEKLFAEEEAFGKVIDMGADKGDFTVTGIIENVPKKSHLEFDVLGSFSSIDEKNKDNKNWTSWGYMWNNYVYMLFEEGTTPDDIQIQLDAIASEENERNEYTTINMFLEPISEFAMGKELSNQIGKNLDAQIIMMLAGLTLVVMLSACFNYSNLSIARSLRRSKEVGIRKVVGASKGQVFNQFIFESVMIALMALVFAYLIFQWLRPQFLSLDPYLQRLLDLKPDFPMILQFILLSVLTGILAGFFPSFFFAKLNPNSVLKSNTSIQLFKGLTIRRALIVLQFTLSIAFITSSIMMYKQYRYALSYDLGYDTENILNLELQGNDAQVLINEISQLSEVRQISSSIIVTSTGDTWGDRIKYKNPADSLIIHFNGVDNKYLELHGHELIAGSNFTHPYLKNDSVPYEIIVDRKFLDYYSLEPEESIGESFSIRGREAVVVGAIESFQYTTINNKVRPFVFRNEKIDEVYYLNIKLQSEDIFATIDKIESIYKKIDDAQPFSAAMYSSSLENVYSEYSIMVKIIGYLAFLAITIAILGLLGMVIYTTETKIREISIRKVLGATEGSIVYLMGKGFMILLVIASVIAIPLTYIFFDTVVFDEFNNRVAMGILEILGGAILVLVIAAFTISSHTIRAARSNPANTLRNE